MKLFRLKSLLSVPSLLNIVGISVAIAVFFVIMSIIEKDLTFNHSIKDYENIYQLNQNDANFMPRPIGDAIGAEIPAIEQVAIFSPWGAKDNYFKKKGDDWSKVWFYHCGACSKGLLKTFSVRILEGDTTAFDSKDKMIVSDKAAQRFDIHVGDVMKVELRDEESFEVVAIYEEPEVNTELSRYEAFVALGDESINDIGQWNYIYYYKVNPKTENPVEELTKAMKPIVYKVYEPYVTPEESEMFDKEYDELGLTVTPIDDLHFSEKHGGYRVTADKKVVYTMLLLAFLIIAIAYINYFNFFMARVPMRLRSINTRKVLGSTRSSLILSLIAESVVFTVISAGIAYLLFKVLLTPLINGMISVDIYMVDNVGMAALSCGVTLFAAVAASIYPALHITSVPPALALKGQMTQGRDSFLRYVLIGFQIVISMVMIICTMFILKNNDYINNFDTGFNSDNLYTVDVSSRLSENRKIVEDKLLQNTDIVGVAWTMGNLVSAQRMSWGRQGINGDHNDEYHFDCYPVSWNFLKFMGIEIAQGRDFTEGDEQCESGAYIFNETMMKRYNLTTDDQIMGHRLVEPDNVQGGLYPAQTVGVCKDFNFRPLQYDMVPFAFYVFGSTKGTYFEHLVLSHLYIRLSANADKEKTIKFISNALNELDPDWGFSETNIISFEQEVSYQYGKERNLTDFVKMFTILAILIAAIGIFGIVLFDAQRRRKEIGIRRVNGATMTEILLMFNRKFFILTIICAVIAVVVSYLIMDKYFSDYAYHYPINWMVFAVAIVFIMLFTAAVVTAASFRAANENPVNTLKSE